MANPLQNAEGSEYLNQRTSVRQFRAYRIGALSALVALIILMRMPPSVARAQTLTTVYNFCPQSGCQDGTSPLSLIQATNGELYGMTRTGGAYDDSECAFLSARLGCGTVFAITPGGTFTTLLSFCTQVGCSTDGVLPYGPLVQAINGDLYGTTEYGGNNNGGTVFKINFSGNISTLYSFCSETNCTDGNLPDGGLIQAPDGDLYGTTSGGTNDNGHCSNPTTMGGCGTIFKITPSGSLTTLYTFCGPSTVYCADGAKPAGPLALAASGALYGTTFEGGAHDLGTVFQLTPNGTLTTLHSFCSRSGCADGALPQAALILTSGGALFGMTSFGGSNGDGTVFKITSDGKLTTLHNFCSLPNCADGDYPSGALVQATNGDLYGTTEGGGTNGAGTVFKLTSSGELTTVYNFCGAGAACTDGSAPNGVIQATSGDFNGTTGAGGLYANGTIFRLNLGLGPFVAPQTPAGEVGARVTLLGTNLTGATSVTFNGTPTTFTVNSSGSAIATTVPAGATTGTVQVVTPGGTLNSNVVYTVR